MQLSDANKVRTNFRLNMISTLFSSLNTKVKNDDEAPLNVEAKESTTQPVLLIIQRTMPIFKDIATLWINEMSVMEVNHNRTILINFFSFKSTFSN